MLVDQAPTVPALEMPMTIEAGTIAEQDGDAGPSLWEAMPGTFWEKIAMLGVFSLAAVAGYAGGGGENIKKEESPVHPVSSAASRPGIVAPSSFASLPHPSVPSLPQK